MIFAGIIALLLFVRIYVNSTKIDPANKKSLEKVGIFRRLMASAVGLISSDLEQWMLKSEDLQTSFYESFTEIMAANDLERARTQTHREFAETSLQHFSTHDQLQLIAPIVRNTTERFYEVRFGSRELTPTESEKINNDLNTLKSALAGQGSS